jgi:iron complex transport system substrate-binding protein
MNACSRKHTLLILLISVFGASLACVREPVARELVTPAPAQPEGKTAGPESWPVDVVDSLRRKVTVARVAARIVSLAPSNTEILHAVGAGRQVVGGTTFDNYPPEARSHTSIGGMTPKSINLEAVTALRPDLVLATSGVQEPIIAPLERLGLTVVALDATDFAGVVRNIRTVGRLTGHSADAEQLANGFLDRVAAVGRRVAARRSPRPKVLYLLREDPLMTAGPATFIGQMIEAAGGINVFGDVTTRFPRPSEEEILARAPEIILCTHGAMTAGEQHDEARRQAIRGRRGWDQIPAVRESRIVFLKEDLVNRPGPRLVEGLEAVAEVLQSYAPKVDDRPAPAAR